MITEIREDGYMFECGCYVTKQKMSSNRLSACPCGKTNWSVESPDRQRKVEEE